jgi:hypothetical protein
MSDSETSLAPGTLEGDKQIVAVLLAQFNACRTEIQARSGYQAAVDSLNITAAGIIGGYYFAYSSNRVLLIIPLLSPMLGIIWADHSINIENLGLFIEWKLMPRLEVILKYKLSDYETRARPFETRLWRRFFLLIAPRLLLYAILPAAALILACVVAPVRDAVFWALVAIGITLILIFCGCAARIQFSGIRRSRIMV